MKRLFTSDFSRRLGHNKLEDLSDVEDNPPKIKDCPHISYCVVRKFGHINCLTESSIKTCTTYRFYEKYKEEGNYFGIGSKI